MPLIPADTELLAGLELGGVPVATALSLATGIPAVFVRKQAKAYGTAKLAEGPTVDARRLLVVEDVVTSGGQIVESVGQLRALGATITTAVCVIDRQQGGSREPHRSRHRVAKPVHPQQTSSDEFLGRRVRAPLSLSR